jgi:hypothetical protein
MSFYWTTADAVDLPQFREDRIDVGLGRELDVDLNVTR